MGMIIYRGPGSLAYLPTPPSPTPGQDAFLANLSFANTTGSATPSASYVSFGQAFRQGDVPSGTVPQLRSEAGTVIPAQFDLRNNWPDGSLRWCEISCVVPSVAGSDSARFYLYRSVTGTYDNAARRSLSDITSGSNIQLALSGLTDFNFTTYAGGATTAGFNAASVISDGRVHLEKMKSGPICDQWRAWMWFPGQPSGGEQLAAWFYVTAWTNQSNGSLATISHIAKLHNGWIAKTNATEYRYDTTYSDGISLSRSSSYDKTITFAGGSFNQSFTCTAHGLQTGDSFTITSTGSMPANITANTVYYAVVLDSNTIRINSFMGSAQGSSGITSSAPSGSPTLTLHRRTVHCCNQQWFACRSNGLSDWTSNEATIYVHPDKSYLGATGLIPPFDVTVSHLATNNSNTPSFDGSASTFWNYSPGNAGRVNATLNDGGIYDMTGWMATWCLRAYANQTVALAQDARICALMMGSMPCYVLNEETGKILTCRGNSGDKYGASGNYPGLGTNKKDSFFQIGGWSTDFVIPTGGGGGWQNTGFDFSHMPEAMHYTIVTEGGAHLIDLQLTYTSAGPLFTWNNPSTITDVAAQPSRTVRMTSVSPYYYGQIYVGKQERGTGWALRNLSNSYAVCPDSWSEKAYLADCLSSNAAFVVDYLTNIATTNFKSLAIWSGWGGDQHGQVYQQNYMVGAAANAYKQTGTSDWLTVCNFHRDRFVNWLALDPSLSTGYKYCIRLTPASDWCSLSEISFVPGSSGGEFDIRMGDSTCAASPPSATWTVMGSAGPTFPIWGWQNGDQIRALHFDTTLSVPYSVDTWYYFVNSTVGSDPHNIGSGQVPYAGTGTIQLSATPGGSPITCTSQPSSPEWGEVYYRPNSLFPTAALWRARYGGSGFNTCNSYLNVAVAAANYLQAAGITGLDTYQSTMAPYWSDTNFNNQQNGQAQWKMQSTFAGIPTLPGINRYVNTNATFGGDGTTMELTGPHAAYCRLGIAISNGMDLTGTGGITIWCQGAEEYRNVVGGAADLAHSCTSPAFDDCQWVPAYGPFGVDPYEIPVVINQGIGSTGGFGTWKVTTNDQIRIYANPYASNGKNNTPIFGVSNYKLVNSGTSLDVEPGSCECCYVNCPCVTFDGIEFYTRGAQTARGGGQLGLALVGGTALAPITVRNCRFKFVVDSDQNAGGFQIVVKASNNLTVNVENCTFFQDSSHFQEMAIGLKESNGTTVNIKNSTIYGSPLKFGAFSNSGCTMNVKNCAMFGLAPGYHDDLGFTYLTPADGTVVNIDHCATDDGLGGTGGINFARSTTTWNANFVDYTVGNFQVKAGGSVIGAGTATGSTTTDIIGTARKTPPNMGAWENL